MRLFHWYVIRNTDLVALETERDQLRVAAQADHIELQRRNEQIAEMLNAVRAATMSETQVARDLQREVAVRVEAQKRAETAEAIVKGQAKHIEALAASNDKMLESIVDMRRVGFSLPSDVLSEPDPDGISSVHNDDLEAIKDSPHLAAADDF